MTRRHAFVVLPVMLLAAGILWLLRGGEAQEPVELTGRGAHYAVVIVLEPRTGPLQARIALDPATPAEVSLFGVMPHMGHTTSEIAAKGDGAGRYVARGELFTMPGVWEIRVGVRGASGTDVIKVNTIVGD
ncbi:hypothetical protein [Nonomuraea diastatica]|uniref:YtkA-like domain-containing protein n=1 Tax=Nonomuraea diastatica TaxID=1848329 RepID=A0A4R4WXX3_9ACTN|nr:hypothetical protein [Nonomuraea diastatica]TDD22713.1 hypothetical protein E1294_11025 [Nonomuraea diastatica]